MNEVVSGAESKRRRTSRRSIFSDAAFLAKRDPAKAAETFRKIVDLAPRDARARYSSASRFLRRRNGD